MPESITSDYPDIANRTLYIEYATKIITGDTPLISLMNCRKMVCHRWNRVTEESKRVVHKKAQ